MLIILEGLDACGKSTQGKLIKNYYEEQGKKVLFTHQPSGSSIGQDVKKLLIKHNRKLVPMAKWLQHCSSHAQHWEEDILPALSRGEVVIMDRCWLSAMAYSGVEGLSLRMIFDMEVKITRYFQPDIIFYFENEKPFTLKDEIQDNSNNSWREQVNSFYKKVFEDYQIEGIKLPVEIVTTDGKSVEDIWSEIKDKLHSKELEILLKGRHE